MKTVDEDVLKAVQTIADAHRNSHVGKVKEKHRKQAEARFETQIELLCDEVEKVMDRKHPAFLLVLALAVVEKLQRHTAEPEFKSFLDEGPFNGW
jgi:hypothetical protein